MLSWFFYLQQFLVLATAERAPSYRSPTLQEAKKWGRSACSCSAVRIRCDTLALFVFQPAAGSGSADHAKWLRCRKACLSWTLKFHRGEMWMISLWIHQLEAYTGKVFKKTNKNNIQYSPGNYDTEMASSGPVCRSGHATERSVGTEPSWVAVVVAGSTSWRGSRSSHTPEGFSTEWCVFCPQVRHLLLLSVKPEFLCNAIKKKRANLWLLWHGDREWMKTRMVPVLSLWYIFTS